MNRIFFALMMLTLPTSKSVAQNFDLGSWNIFNLKYTVDDKWTLFAEAQLRSLKFYNNFHYHEYKGGIDYKIFPNLRLVLGLGKYDTYKEGGNFKTPKNNDEFRIWPQVTMQQSLWKFKVEQRYRAEFRFTNNGYRNRFRYRLGLMYPFGKEKNDYKPFQISVSNEIFFANRDPYFERNRFLTSFSYKTSKVTTLQAGYLHQFDYKINGETGRDFLVLGLFIEIDNKNIKKKNEIAIEDY